MKGRQLARHGLADQRQIKPVSRLPAPLEAVMPQDADRSVVPGNRKGQGRFVADRGGRLFEKIALRLLAFAVPFIFARQCPERIGSPFRVAVFLDQAFGKIGAHGIIDRCGMLAAQAEGLEETLADRSKHERGIRPGRLR